MSKPTITQQLYDAITQAVTAGWSINRIAKEAGINRTSLQQWYTGARDSLSVDTAAGLAMWLGMTLSKPKIPSSDEGEPSRKPASKKTKKKR